MKSCYIHRLVYEHCHGEIPEGMQIDHLDHNASNNGIANLKLVPREENMKNRRKYVWKKNRKPVVDEAKYLLEQELQLVKDQLEYFKALSEVRKIETQYQAWRAQKFFDIAAGNGQVICQLLERFHARK
jgi:hypothetical protein